MQKLWKVMLAGILLSLAVCFSCGAEVSAEIVSGEGLEYSWEFDTDTGTLTVNDSGWGINADYPVGDEDRNVLWLPYAEQIRELIYTVEDDWTLSYGLPYQIWEDLINLEKSTAIRGDIQCQINYQTQTMTIDSAEPGKIISYHSDFPVLLSDWHYMHNPQDENIYGTPTKPMEKLKKLIIGDGIKGPLTGLNQQHWEFYDLETLYLGKNVTYDESLYGTASTSYEVDPANPNFAVYNGALYSKDYRILYAVPYRNPGVALHASLQQYANGSLEGTIADGVKWKLDTTAKTLNFSGEGKSLKFEGSQVPWENYWRSIETITISGGIKEVSCNFRLWKVQKWKFGSSIQNIIIGNEQPLQGYEVDAQNPWYSSFNGALYSKDGSILYSLPYHFTSYEFPTKLKTIATGAISGSHIPTIVIPWGVETLEEKAFQQIDEQTTVILPDTLRSVRNQEDPWYNTARYICSDKNPIRSQSTLNFLGPNDKYHGKTTAQILQETYPQTMTLPAENKPSSQPEESYPLSSESYKIAVTSSNPIAESSKPAEASTSSTSKSDSHSSSAAEKSSLPVSEQSAENSPAQSESKWESSNESSDELPKSSETIRNSSTDSVGFSWIWVPVLLLATAISILIIVLIRIRRGKDSSSNF
ncbi:MAG: hypothetical protein ACOX6P_10955 [Candidatus Merdivicinus sp.]|jgi:hypothetical protein